MAEAQEHAGDGLPAIMLLAAAFRAALLQPPAEPSTTGTQQHPPQQQERRNSWSDGSSAGWLIGTAPDAAPAAGCEGSDVAASTSDPLVRMAQHAVAAAAAAAVPGTAAAAGDSHALVSSSGCGGLLLLGQGSTTMQGFNTRRGTHAAGGAHVPAQQLAAQGVAPRPAPAPPQLAPLMANDPSGRSCARSRHDTRGGQRMLPAAGQRNHSGALASGDMLVLDPVVPDSQHQAMPPRQQQAAACAPPLCAAAPVLQLLSCSSLTPLVLAAAAMAAAAGGHSDARTGGSGSHLGSGQLVMDGSRAAVSPGGGSASDSAGGSGPTAGRHPFAAAAAQVQVAGSSHTLAQLMGVPAGVLRLSSFSSSSVGGGAPSGHAGASAMAEGPAGRSGAGSSCSAQRAPSFTAQGGGSITSALRPVLGVGREQQQPEAGDTDVLTAAAGDVGSGAAARPLQQLPMLREHRSWGSSPHDAAQRSPHGRKQPQPLQGTCGGGEPATAAAAAAQLAPTMQRQQQQQQQQQAAVRGAQHAVQRHPSRDHGSGTCAEQQQQVDVLA
jgi:hypothetical protein